MTFKHRIHFNLPKEKTYKTHTQWNDNLDLLVYVLYHPIRDCLFKRRHIDILIATVFLPPGNGNLCRSSLITTSSILIAKKGKRCLGKHAANTYNSPGIIAQMHIHVDKSAVLKVLNRYFDFHCFWHHKERQVYRLWFQIHKDKQWKWNRFFNVTAPL